MTTSVLSPKFQVVIPEEIRKSLNLKPGQRISFIAKDGHIELHPILAPEQLIGFLKDKAVKPTPHSSSSTPPSNQQF